MTFQTWAFRAVPAVRFTAALAVSVLVAMVSHTTAIAAPESSVDEPAVLQIGEPRLTDESGAPFRNPPPPQSAPMPAGELSSVAIELSRDYPDYRFVLRGDGTAMFVGASGALMIGEHHFTVAPDDVEMVLKQFQTAEFWSLDQTYSCGISHVPEYVASVSIGGRTQSVRHRCGLAVGMPSAVVDAELAILRTGEARRWLVGDASTITQLETEHFDFRSIAAADLLFRGMQLAPDRFLLELLARGAPLNARQGPLVAEAAFWGRTTLFHALLSAGAFAPGQTGAKEAALGRAVEALRPDLVAEVLGHHPDTNAELQYGKTAVDLAAGGPHLEEEAAKAATIIRLLAVAGAGLDRKNKHGETPLHRCWDIAAATALVEAGASLESRNDEGETPLLSAHTEDIAMLLIESGADVTAKNKRGKTALDLAKRRGWPRVVEVLRGKRTS